MKPKILTVKYTMRSPLSHIGEVASTGSYFQQVQTSFGKLPIVTANSVRGIIRDAGAKHLLDTIGIKVDKEVFHTLFSGGNLMSVMKNDLEKARQVRENFPLISVLGAALGDMIMAGKLNVMNAYPICIETESITQIPSGLSWHNLMGEIEFTRTDDSKNDMLEKYIVDAREESKAKASTQMRFSVQYLAVGTELWQQIYVMPCTRLELGALITAMYQWFERPMIGGMAARGFGLFGAEVSEGGETMLSTEAGERFINSEWKNLMDEYSCHIMTVDYESKLPLLKGAKKDGKKTNGSPKNNSDDAGRENQ